MAAGAAGPGAPGGARAVMDAGREWSARMSRLRGELYRVERSEGQGARAGELEAEIRREKVTLERARDAVEELAALAARDPSRRTDLIAAAYRAVSMFPAVDDNVAAQAIMVVDVLLDAGRPLSIGEVARRMSEERGRCMSEEALYAARFSGAIRKDRYDVLHLSCPVGHGGGGGEDWMYEALERAVEAGVARYADGGIEMAGGRAGGLSAREAAGAGAVAEGVNAFGETPGLAEWFNRAGRGPKKVTWAEATVIARLARAEVGEAWDRLSRGRALEAAPEARAAHAR